MAEISPSANAIETPTDATGNVTMIEAGEAISQFEFLYFDSATQKVKLANNATEEEATVKYLAMADTASGNSCPCLILQNGMELIFDAAVLSAGTSYAISSTDGNMEDIGSVANTEHVFMIGTCYADTFLTVHLQYCGVKAA